MERKRGGLVPIGEAFSGLDRPEKTIRESAHQALHHFTQADQVDELVGASEADPDLGFMARLMALCSLPRTNPGNRKEYVRRNGPYALVMTGGRPQQAPLRQSAPPAAGLGVHRSGADPKPRAGPGPFALRVHAVAGDQQRQRRRSRGANPAPQPDGPAL